MDELFNKWGVDTVILQKFKDHHLTVSDLSTLTENELRDVVPEVGLRRAVKPHLDAFQKAATNNMGLDHEVHGLTSLAKEQQGMLDELVSFSGGEDSGSSSRASSRSAEPTSAGPSPTQEKSSDTASEVSTPRSSGPNPASSSSRTSSRSADRLPAATQAKSSAVAQEVTPLASRPNQVPSSSSLFDMEEVLSVPKGVMVVNNYKTNGVLTDNDRSSLAQCIVNHELKGDYAKRITGARAKLLAEQVLQRFPTEIMSVWYRVVERPNGTGKLVKGRIITRFYGQRRALIKAGLLDTSHDIEESEDEFENLDEDDPENLHEALAWLKSGNSTPWTRVLSSWEATSKHTRNLLQNPPPEAESEESALQKSKKRKITRRGAKPKSTRRCRDKTY